MFLYFVDIMFISYKVFSSCRDSAYFTT